jgi:hypothetical protein
MGSNPKKNEDLSCRISGGNSGFKFWAWFSGHVEILEVSKKLVAVK